MPCFHQTHPGDLFPFQPCPGAQGAAARGSLAPPPPVIPSPKEQPPRNQAEAAEQFLEGQLASYSAASTSGYGVGDPAATANSVATGKDVVHSMVAGLNASRGASRGGRDQEGFFCMSCWALCG